MDKPIWEAPELTDPDVMDDDTLSRIQEALDLAWQARWLIRRGIDPRVCGWPWRT